MLGLPFAARRMFDETGQEQVLLTDLQRDQLVSLITEQNVSTEKIFQSLDPGSPFSRMMSDLFLNLLIFILDFNFSVLSCTYLPWYGEGSDEVWWSGLGWKNRERIPYICHSFFMKGRF